MTDYQALLTSFNELQPCGLMTAREPVDLEHAEAKELLQQMVRNKHLDRKANGQYFVTNQGALYLNDNRASHQRVETQTETDVAPSALTEAWEKTASTKPKNPEPEKTGYNVRPRDEEELPELEHVSTDELIEIIKNGQQAKELLKQRLIEVGIVL